MAAVGTARISAVNDVSAAGTTQVGNVNSAGRAQTAAVNSAGAAQVQAVQAKGTEVIGSIPPDYSDLSDEVSDLNNALNTKAPAIYDTASGNIASFSDGADDMPIKKLVGTIEPVQTGSGDPSPTNVRPITGHTGMTVTQVGENLWNYIPDGTSTKLEYTNLGDGGLKVEVKDATAARFSPLNGTRLKDYNLQVGETYTVWQGVTSPEKLKLFMSNGAGGGWHALDPAWTFTYSASMANYNLCVMAVSSYTVGDTQVFYPQLVKGSSIMAPWMHYTSTTIPISWETEAGTVYGGTLDATSGKLTVNQRYIEQPTYTIVDYSGRRAARIAWNINDYPTPTESTLCTIAGYSNPAADYSWLRVNASAVMVSFSASATDEEINAAMQDCAFCLPMVEPVSYDIHINPDVTAFLGTNNIWTDTGSVSVEYPADTKLYIDRKIAEALS